MTCIVGLEDNGKVWIGGDSRAVSGYGHIRDTKDPKVFTRGEFIFGNCGYPRQGQILRYNLVLPIPPTTNDFIDDFIIGDLIPCIRKAFTEHGWMQNDDHGRETVEDGGPFLLGFRGILYKIEDNFQVLRPTDGFWAIGSGQDYAYGAISVLKILNEGYRDSQEILTIVLRAAEERDAGVCKPFTILSL